MDGQFEYVPIPEREPVDGDVPTYADLPVEVPARLAAEPVHLDPSFAEYPPAAHYTYGDEHAVKAAPLADLEAGDHVWFYASLEPEGPDPVWSPSGWAACVIGEFRLAIDPVEPADRHRLPPRWRRVVESNAHFDRRRPDARVIAVGDPAGSRLLERAVPLSDPAGGTVPNDLVTVHSTDSGAGPWWRRPLRFDPVGAAAMRRAIDRNEGPTEG